MLSALAAQNCPPSLESQKLSAEALNRFVNLFEITELTRFLHTHVDPQATKKDYAAAIAAKLSQLERDGDPAKTLAFKRRIHGFLADKLLDPTFEEKRFLENIELFRRNQIPIDVIIPSPGGLYPVTALYRAAQAHAPPWMLTALLKAGADARFTPDFPGVQPGMGPGSAFNIIFPVYEPWPERRD